MKIRFRKVTNIRSDHRSLGAAPLGVVYANTLLEVDGEIHEGATVNGDNRWWRDHNGWYYWAGETEAVMPEAVTETPQLAPKEAPVPQPKPVDTALPPVPAVELVALPVPKDAVANAGVIPDGEWRALDEEIHLEAAPEPEQDLMPEPASEPEPAQVTHKVIAHPPPQDSMELLPPRAQRLNWGLEAGQIPAKWWQEKQLTGKGIAIAILCTGADKEHPDLTGHPAHLFANFVDQEPMDDLHGLGTQAAIVTAGKGQIAYGVAPDATLLLGKIGAVPNDITPERLIAGLEWAIEQKADVAAMLVDFIEVSDEQKKALNEAIARALEHNIVLLAPVGNSTERRPEDRFPAALEGVISIGAHHSFNRRSDFSAKSYHLDLLAPGEGMNTSDIHQGFGPNLKNTAIATAYAAGFAALVRQWEKQGNLKYRPDDITNLLRETAHYEGINKGKDTEMGFGILNPLAVLERLNT